MVESRDNCPPEAELERFAAGEEADAAITAHVESCPACCAALDAIRANNAFLSQHSRSLRHSEAAALWEPPQIPGYRMVREIHRGGQAVVFEAVRESTRQLVAIKVFRESRFATPSEEARFDREVRALAELDHPNIVPIHDSGATASFFYLVMKYIDGRPLDEVDDFGLRGAPAIGAASRPASRRERIERLLRLFARVCAAVEAAHVRGIVHRDLKPSNIVVDSGGEPFVLDFGLAKLTTTAPAATTTLTRSGKFMGSLPWASPEQTEGRPEAVDLRTDVYSLGVILYEMLTGRFPYPVTGSMRTVLDHIANTAPRRPSSVRRELNGELDTILLKALEKDKQRRYQSVAALRADVEHFIRGEPIEAKRDSTWYVLSKTARRHKLALLVSTAFVTLVLGFALDRWRHAEQLERALHDVNIERGRLEGRQGNTALAEGLLWREYLAYPSANDERRPAYWALWELYAAQPCVFSAASFANEPALGISADGRVFAAAGAGRLRAWRVDNRGVVEPICDFESGGRSPSLLAVSSDGAHVAIAGDRGIVSVRGLAEQAEERSFVAHDGPLAALEFLETVELVTVGAADGRIRVWNLQGGALLREGNIGLPLAGATVCPARMICAAAPQDADEVAIWDLAGPKRSGAIDLTPIIRAAGARRITSVALTDDGRWLAVASYDTVGVWDLRDVSLITILPHDWVIAGLAFIRNSPRLVVAGDPGIQVWDLDAKVAEPIYAGNEGGVRTLAGGDGLLAALDQSGILRVWESAPQLGRRFSPTTKLHGVAFHPGGDLIATCGERGEDRVNLEIWDRRSQRVTHRMELPEPIASSLTFSPDGGSLAVATYDGPSVRVWDLQRNEPRDVVVDLRGISTIAFTASGEFLICGDDQIGAVVACDLVSGATAWRLDELPARIPSLATSPDGAYCAVADHTGQITLLDARTGTMLHRFSAHRGAARIVAFDASARRLVSGGDDGRVCVWDVSTLNRAATLVGHHDAVYGAAFVLGDELIASGGRDGSIRLWDPDAERLLATLPGDGGMISQVVASPVDDVIAFGTFGAHLCLWDLRYYSRHIDGNRARHARPGVQDAAINLPQ